MRVAQQAVDHSRAVGHVDSRDRGAAAPDQLTVQQRPTGIPVPLVAVAAGEARRLAGDDERTGGDPALLVGDGKMRRVRAEIVPHLRGRRRPVDEDHSDRALPHPSGGRHPDVLQRIPHPAADPGVADVDRLDPGGPRRRAIGPQQGAQALQELPRLGAGRAEAVRDEIERAQQDAVAQPRDERFDPGLGGVHPQRAADAELEGVAVTPQRSQGGVDPGEQRRRAGHAPIVLVSARAGGRSP
ncbi:hypothetical protein GCM10027408_31160 [Microbacterium tumbae]